MALPDTIQSVIDKFGSEEEITLLSAPKGQSQDQVYDGNDTITIKAAVVYSQEEKDSRTITTAKFTISGVAGYTPRMSDKIRIGENKLTINKITPANFAGELVAYDVEAVG